MGSGTCPHSGYVLPATLENFKTLKVLLGNYEADFKISEMTQATDELEEVIWEFFKAIEDSEAEVYATIGNKRIIIRLFHYDHNNGDRYDDICEGYYLSFAESQLFISKLSKVGNALAKKDLLPDFQQWTVYG